MTTRARNNWIAAILTFLALTLVLPLAAQTPAQLAAGIKARADSIYRLSRSTTIRRQTTEIKALADKVALLPVADTVAVPVGRFVPQIVWRTGPAPWALQVTPEDMPGMVRVTFAVDGVAWQTENAAPWCSFGDDGVTCALGSLPAGPHTVLVRGLDAGGAVLAELVVAVMVP